MKKTTKSEGASPITLLRDIQQGNLAVAAISKESRKDLVCHLIGEAYSAPEIAEILKVDKRTVFRDIKAIRISNAVSRDPEITRELIGGLVLQARHSTSRLQRIARDRATQSATQVDAEREAWRVQKELADLLIRMGFLPQAATELRADFTHHVEALPSVADLRAEQKAFHAQWESAGAPEDMKDAIAAAESLLSQADAADKIASLQKQLPEPSD